MSLFIQELIFYFNHVSLQAGESNGKRETSITLDSGRLKCEDFKQKYVLVKFQT